MMGVRYVENRAVIEALGTFGSVLDGTREIAESIADDVKKSTGSSSRLKPYGERMVIENTATGTRVGPDWGPSVPVEFGTARTPAKRILLGAAERSGGRVEFS